jgi:hypothetical protein
MTLLDAKDEILKGIRVMSRWLDVNHVDQVELEPLEKMYVN